MSFIYRSKQLILLAGDAVCLAVGLWLAVVLRYFQLPTWSKIEPVMLAFLIVFFFWIIINYIAGLYDLAQTKNNFDYYKKISEAGLTSFIVGIIFFYLLPNYAKSISPKTILLLSVTLGYGLIAGWRFVYNILIGERRLKTNVIFVGWNETVTELVNFLAKNPGRGYRAMAIIADNENIKSNDLPGVEVYHQLNTIRPAITTKKAGLVVVAPHLEQDPAALRELYELLFWDVEIANLSSFYETVTGRVTPTAFSEGWFLKHLKQNRRPIYQKTKTLIDYLAGGLMGIIFLPLFPFIALAIKSSSHGSIFFKQKRVGKNGKTFTIYKFRSMFSLSPDGSAEINGFQFAQKQDTRVTLVGRFLRQTRLDELPQFINLIKGELSLIGPRPERPEIVEKLKEQMPYYPLRHTIKPGITGWAVIHQNYTSDLASSLEKLQYDLYYIKNRSALLDLSILLKTVNVVVRMMGQ
jgi:exopolysaccharide biosynthesis polyprenyl glycosylphosphotransferase